MVEPRWTVSGGTVRERVVQRWHPLPFPSTKVRAFCCPLLLAPMGVSMVKGSEVVPMYLYVLV